jgi:hypothetical protein
MIICKILFGLIKAKYAVSLVGRWSCGKWDGPETVGCSHAGNKNFVVFRI